MKKLLAVTVLFTAFSFTSLDANAKRLPQTECGQQAQDFGEFMDGHNNNSGAYWAIEYYETFC